MRGTSRPACCWAAAAHNEMSAKLDDSVAVAAVPPGRTSSCTVLARAGTAVCTVLVALPAAARRDRPRALASPARLLPAAHCRGMPARFFVSRNPWSCVPPCPAVL